MAMNLVDRIILSAARARGFVLGKGVVESFDATYGKRSDEFQPAVYGDYLATSNNVYACAMLRANLLSSLPLRGYRLGRGGRKTELERRHEMVELFNRVNPFWTTNRLLVMTELSLCLWGEAFWFLERGPNGRGRPREIWWGRPDRVRVVPHPTEYLSGFIYEPLTSMQAIPFLPGEVIWFRYPNPIDEYEGLSPLAAARLAADYAGAAARSNMRLHDQGMNAGGVVMPKNGRMAADQAEELSILLDRRFKGADKAHRWGVLTDVYDFFGLSAITPREAQFIEGLNWSLEEIARAYGIPLDLVGGQRTYENVEAAERAVWAHTLLPEARFIATELTEQLAPLFEGADLIEFDLGDVAPLQDDEDAQWQREKEQIVTGTLLINEWRDNHGLEPLAWGDTWWMPLGLTPFAGMEAATVAPDADAVEAERSFRRQAPAYDSPRHASLMRQFDRRSERHIRAIREKVKALFARQRDSVLDRLRGGRSDDEDDPFNRAQWVKEFRVGIRPLLADMVVDAGAAALSDLAISIAFDVLNPQVQRFIERRAQRFAQRVNETTYQALRNALNAGIDSGETLDQLAGRVQAVMGERIRSSAETIARTEVIGGFNGGTLEGWKQSGVVKGKAWLATLGDDRTRESHDGAHGQTVGLDEDFTVGAGQGPHPGAIGVAEEDINCRCTMTAVL
jgi:HK97 family phage portal protein